MKIGLIDVDGHNFPNLALMKISAYHKQKKDTVEWVTYGDYDKIYKSKVFTFTNDVSEGLVRSKEIVLGGTGYNYICLTEEIDKMCPDYSIYNNNDKAYGFLTRGCPNTCSWCIVPKKEGDIKAYADILDFLDNRNIAILMDNNVLASEHGLNQIKKIIDLKIKVDFNQGLDCRIIAKNENIAELLSKLSWYKPLRMSC